MTLGSAGLTARATVLVIIPMVAAPMRVRVPKGAATEGSGQAAIRIY